MSQKDRVYTSKASQDTVVIVSLKTQHSEGIMNNIF